MEGVFAPQKDGTTLVSITEAGFTDDGDELVNQVTDSTQGFTLVLAGLKALLGHNVRLNLVANRYSKGIEEHERVDSWARCGAANKISVAVNGAKPNAR